MEFQDKLRRLIGEIGRIVLMMVHEWHNAMSTLEQIWVLWEVFNIVVEANAEFSVLMSPGEIQKFTNTLKEGNVEAAEALLNSIDANSAKADNPLDRGMILQLIEDCGIEHAEAETMYREAMQDMESGEDTTELLHRIGYCMYRQGKMVESEKLHREALGARKRMYGDDH